MENDNIITAVNNILQKNNSDAFLMRGDSNDADLYFSTHFLTSDPFTYVQTKGKTEILLVPDMEKGRAKMESRVLEIRTLEDYGYRTKVKATKDGPLAYCEILAELLQQEDVRRILVPYDFPHYTAQTLKERGFTVTPIQSPFREIRAQKSEAEIGNIRSVQNACEQAMGAAIEAISTADVVDGVLFEQDEELTSQHIRATIEHRLLDYGCEAESTIVACGKGSANPHWEGEGALLANEPIVIDIFPRSKTNRYYADMTRTVIRGTASDKLEDMYKAVVAAQDKGLEMVRPGVTCGEVHSAVCDELEKRGYATTRNNSQVGFIHSTGHGVGLDIHEFPNVGDNDIALKEGNVITIEPGLYYPDVGGLRMEDLVVVTTDGCENLNHFEKNFVLSD
ncbi:MAG: Xaa-Pro peptidase family protein [Euryarchaeota archaeon]|nr:Xaa-Pro peptidase family protein [Euryarchaeota archaeon]